MNLKTLIRIAIIISLILSCFSYMIFFGKNDMNSKDQGIVERYNILQNKTNANIIKNIILINEKRDTLNISELLIEKKLIFRFSELHCDSCIINEFKNLKKNLIKNKIEFNNVIIISYYNNFRNLNIFKRINELQDFEIYNLLHNDIGLEVDKMSVPYFFVLDNNLNISQSLIPLKHLNHRTDNYLNSVLKSLKNN